MNSSFIAGPGIFENLPMDVYHRSAGISKTGVCQLDRAPSLYRQSLEVGKKSPPSRSMRTGSVFHLVMEGAFERECVVSPEIKDKRQKEWKEFLAAHPDRICLTPAEAESVHAMRRALLSYGPAKDILSQKGRFEVSYYWQDEASSLLCKCRPDFITDAHDIVVDFKTCQDATEAAFVRAAERYHYHVSAAMTVDGIAAHTGRIPRYIFLAIEPKAPYLTAAYEATEEDIRKGRSILRRALRTLQVCEQNCKWPGLSEEIKPLDVGRWRRANDEDEFDEGFLEETKSLGEWWEL